jgi:hypothetical protein
VRGCCSAAWLQSRLQARRNCADPRPSAFQAGHIPSCYGSYERCALSPVAAACRWSLLLLSTRRRPFGSKPTRTLQGMARVRSGQAPAWPLVSDRSARRGSGVKRDFACTFTRRFSPVLVARRSQSRLMLEGRARTLSGPSPDLSQAATLPPSGRSEDLLIRRSMEHVRSVRRNPYPLVSVLPGVRNRRHGPAPSGQSVRKL